MKRHRSPAYPSNTLTESVEKARQFYLKEGKHPAPVAAAVTHWGYAPKSSGGLLTISSLKAYGLLEDEGSGEDRMLKLTQAGLDIVRDERETSPERDALLQQSALQPKIIKELMETYPDGKASAETLRYFLVKKEYNPNAVSDVLKVYNDARKYLSLTPLSPQVDKPKGESGAAKDARAGEGKKQEGSGMINPPPPIIPPPPPPHVQPSGGNMRQETFALDTGDVVIQWPTKMTQASFEDFSDWLDILKRKVKRSIEAQAQEKASDEKDPLE